MKLGILGVRLAKKDGLESCVRDVEVQLHIPWHGGRVMSVANQGPWVKAFSEIRELSEQLCQQVKTAVEDGMSLYDFESQTLGIIVKMGHAASMRCCSRKARGSWGPPS